LGPGAKMSNLGFQCSALTGATITSDSSGGIYFRPGCMIINTDNTLTSPAIKCIESAPSTAIYAGNVNIVNSEVGAIWTQDSGSVYIANCDVKGDVRLGGKTGTVTAVANYWSNSNLSSTSDTFTIAATATGLTYIDNLNGMKSNGGMYCDSTRATPYGYSEPGATSKSRIQQATYTCVFPGTGTIDTVVIPGVTTAATIATFTPYGTAAQIYASTPNPDSLVIPKITLGASDTVFVRRCPNAAQSNGKYALQILLK
jgi:hypothetical protein